MTANGAVYALLVGIDAYPPPVPWLAGCRNDVTDLSAFLEGRLGERLRLVTLLDREATRQAIVDAMRTHLGQAGAGDVALFSYSGHGSEEPVPKAFAALEPTGRIQTLVCVDTGRRDADGVLIRPIADKELAVLLGEIASKGPHVVALLDCCHSGTGTRDAGAPYFAEQDRELLVRDRPDPDAIGVASTRIHADEGLDPPGRLEGRECLGTGSSLPCPLYEKSATSPAPASLRCVRIASTIAWRVASRSSRVRPEPFPEAAFQEGAQVGDVVAAARQPGHGRRVGVDPDEQGVHGAVRRHGTRPPPFVLGLALGSILTGQGRPVGQGAAGRASDA